MQKDTTMQSLSNKTGDEFDKFFIVAMTAHHTEAIQMAILAKEKSSRKEILELADNIISAQTKENEEMHLWQSEWNKNTTA